MKSALRVLSLLLLALLSGSAWAQQQTGPYIQVSPTPSKLSIGGPGFVQVDANGIASVVAQAPGSGTVTNTSGALGANSMVVGNGGADIKTVAGSVGGAFTTSGPFTTTGAASGVTFALPANGPFTFTFPPASQTIASLAGAETFTNKIYNGGQLSGTFSGNPTFSGVPLFTNLVPGTQVACLGLDSGFHLVTLNASCGAGGGVTFANPTATASDVAVNGSATTAMRSDAAPAVQKATNAVFGLAKGDGTTLTCVAGVCSSLTGGAGTVTQNGNLTTNTILIGGTNGTTDAKADTHISENGTQTTINYNSGALTASPTGTTLQIGQADATANRVTMDAFGAANSLGGRRAAGTNASKTATLADTVVLSLDSLTYDGTNYSANSRAKVALLSAETQSPTAQGSYIDLSTTLKTTTTTAARLRVNDDGGLTAALDVAGAGPTGGSKGAGTVNVSGGYYLNGVSVNAGRTAVADANCGTLTNASVLEAFTTVLTAARSCTLPAANTLLAGQRICFVDEGDGTNPAINGANTVTLNRAGSDKINGATSFVMGVGYAAVCLESDASAKYSTVTNQNISAQAATSNNFLTGIGSDGVFTRAQPSVSNISGFGTGVATALGVNVGSAGAPVVLNGALGTPSSGTGTNITGIPNVNVNAVTTGAGTTHTLVGPREYWFCTGTCTVTVPVPVAGYEFCVANNVAVTSVITLAALGSSSLYGKTDQSAYGTAGTGTAVAGGAAGDKICLIGKDSTHYNVASYAGTWTMN